MEKHPLQYFIDLIEGRKIAALKESFLTVNPHYSVIEINFKEEYFEHLVDDVHNRGIVSDRMYFKFFLKQHLHEKKADALKAIDLHLLQQAEAKQKENFIGIIEAAIKDLIFQCKQYPDASKYTTFEEVLTEMLETINRKYFISAQKEVLQAATNNFAIKWNAGVASLCTLFYELASDYKIEKKGISFLTVNPDQLKKFILTNFVDEEGNSFSETSVATYLDSRADKKAKRNRVEIDKILPKTKA